MLRPLPLILTLAFALLSLQARAADEVFATAEGAIRGYDPVAYHLQSRAVRGLPALTQQWNGATWHFASEANRKRFAANPQRYAPRFGGYCAYGTAQGYKVSTDPTAFALVGGRLYLNNSPRVQLIWNLDRPGYIAKANGNWTQLEAAPYANDE